MKPKARFLAPLWAMLMVLSSLVMATPANASGLCGSDIDDVLDRVVAGYKHDGKLYEVSFCLVRDDYLTEDYHFARFKFDDDGGDLLANEHVFVHGVPVANKIQIRWMNLYHNGSYVQQCDQTNDPDNGDSADGGGCDWGDHGTEGPCKGLKDIQNHPRAEGRYGCDGDGTNINMSQIVKYNGSGGSWSARVEFRIEWWDGNVSNWKQLYVSGS
jgi:hypothetical protein